MYTQVTQLNIQSELISKVTGMLIDLEILELDEIIEMLSDNNILQERINEAVDILLEEDDDASEQD